MNTGCAACGCQVASPAHAIRAALAKDDLDGAIALGLLDAAPCDGCDEACTATLLVARDERRAALAARERFRARQQRLARRAAEKAASRTPVPAPSGLPALPKAAADVLARALARAKGGAS